MGRPGWDGMGEGERSLAQMLHVGNIYLHFPLNVAIFHLMWVNNPYMDPMGRWWQLLWVHYLGKIFNLTKYFSNGDGMGFPGNFCRALNGHLKWWWFFSKGIRTQNTLIIQVVNLMG